MTDFFDRVVARALGREVLLSPRRRSRFEVEQPFEEAAIEEVPTIEAGRAREPGARRRGNITVGEAAVPVTLSVKHPDSRLPESPVARAPTGELEACSPARDITGSEVSRPQSARIPGRAPRSVASQSRDIAAPSHSTATEASSSPSKDDASRCPTHHRQNGAPENGELRKNESEPLTREAKPVTRMQTPRDVSVRSLVEQQSHRGPLRAAQSAEPDVRQPTESAVRQPLGRAVGATIGKSESQAAAAPLRATSSVAPRTRAEDVEVIVETIESLSASPIREVPPPPHMRAPASTGLDEANGTPSRIVETPTVLRGERRTSSGDIRVPPRIEMARQEEASASADAQSASLRASEAAVIRVQTPRAVLASLSLESTAQASSNAADDAATPTSREVVRSLSSLDGVIVRSIATDHARVCDTSAAALREPILVASRSVAPQLPVQDEAAVSSPNVSPVLRISIGRIDVRCPPPLPPARPAPAAPSRPITRSAPRISLDDYLAQRDRSRS